MNLIKSRRNLLIHLCMAFMGGYAGMYGILVRGWIPVRKKIG